MWGICVITPLQQIFVCRKKDLMAVKIGAVYVSLQTRSSAFSVQTRGGKRRGVGIWRELLSAARQSSFIPVAHLKHEAKQSSFDATGSCHILHKLVCRIMLA